MFLCVYFYYLWFNVIIDSKCGSPQTTDAKYLEVCSGKKCNCTNTTISNVSISHNTHVYHIMYCIVEHKFQSGGLIKFDETTKFNSTNV